MNWEETKAFINSLPPHKISKFHMELLMDLEEAYCDLLTLDDIKCFCKIATEADDKKLEALGSTGAIWTLKLDHPKIDYKAKLEQKEKDFIAHIQKKLLKAKSK